MTKSKIIGVARAGRCPKLRRCSDAAVSHIRVYARRRTYTRICMHIRVPARIYAYMCAYTRICKHIRVHIRVYASIYAYVRTYTHICMHIRAYVRIRAYTRICETAASLQHLSLGHRPARATPMIFDLGHLTAPFCRSSAWFALKFKP